MREQNGIGGVSRNFFSQDALLFLQPSSSSSSSFIRKTSNYDRDIMNKNYTGKKN